MKRLLILLLFLPACRPSYAGDIIVGPETANPGSTFVVQLPADVPYTVEPKPSVLIPLRDESGNRVLLIQGAESPGYTFKVDHQVIHPTPEEIETAPLDDKSKFLEWLKTNATDEIFRDSLNVKVGEQPDPPGPGPGPEPNPLTGFAKKVYDRAKQAGGPGEAERFAGNYAAILRSINDGAYSNLPTDEANKKIVKDLFDINDPLTNEYPAWNAFFADLAEWFKEFANSGEFDTRAGFNKRIQDIHDALVRASK